MCGEVVLAAWSLAGLAWWIIAWRLVRADHRAKASASGFLSAPPRPLSIFKTLPPLHARDFGDFAPGLESFLAQLDPASEMLLGAHEEDRATVAPFVAAMGEKYPKAHLRVVFRPGPDSVAHPKIAGLMELASLANGELWFWSDADIIAPPGFLATAQSEIARAGAGMVTFPYVALRSKGAGTLFEALFVNVEFYPGVLLLRRCGPVDFGFGAGMIFEREAFLRNVNWTDLGSFLADDFQLGQRLRPVQISMARLETIAPARTWSAALGHDLRWNKTIRWNRPGGYFARILILPVAGWLLAAGLHPGNPFAWAGLIGMIQADVVAASAICRGVGCKITMKDGLNLQFWGLWRVAVWILSWLPGPVTWSGRIWHGPRAEMAKSA